MASSPGSRRRSSRAASPRACRRSGQASRARERSFKEICDAADKTAPPNTKGVWDEVAKGGGRACGQGDFRRDRRAVDAPCREGQARNRDEEGPVGGRQMARIWRHRRALAAAFVALAGVFLAPALAQDQGPNAGTDLYDRPVLAVDPGMHADDDPVASRRRGGAVRRHGRRRSDGEGLVGRRRQALAHDLDSGRP